MEASCTGGNNRFYQAKARCGMVRGIEDINHHDQSSYIRPSMRWSLLGMKIFDPAANYPYT
jgi:hypothetical protein